MTRTYSEILTGADRARWVAGFVRGSAVTLAGCLIVALVWHWTFPAKEAPRVCYCALHPKSPT